MSRKNGNNNSVDPEIGTLSGHLWEAANILRGPVDAADFKTCIFPLLFFKRLSDVYDEEYAVALDESDDDVEFAQFPENHRFQVPEGCHWKDVRAKSANIGHALQKAMRCIEQANPDTLHGIFGDAQWTNKDRLSDALLKDLIEHFSSLNLGNEHCRADILGQAYEYLIKKFADLTNKKAGEFYTPRSVVALMVRVLAPRAGETIYDPACGTGGMLLEALHHVKEHGGDENLMLGKLYGQEKNLTTSSIARMNLFLHGAEDFHIERGDTLRLPAFYSGDSLATFDCVIANPPFSLEKWGDDVWINDPYGRNFAGLPPARSGDFAWVQYMIKSMARKTGRMAVVLPHGVLFRMSKEGEIRRRLLEMDILEAVIGLGQNIFYGTGPRAVHSGLPRQQAQGAPPESAVHRRLQGVQDRPCPERAAAGTRGQHPSLVRGLSGCGRDLPGGHPRRDPRERFQPEHPPLRGAGDQGGIHDHRSGHHQPQGIAAGCICG